MHTKQYLHMLFAICALKIFWRASTSVPKIMIICFTVSEIWHMTDVIVFFIWGYFLPFYPTNLPKKWRFQKNKKTPGDIIILHKCTKNHDYMLYCSWDIAHDGCDCYFSFWAIFCPFTLLAWPKNLNFKKMKKTPADIIILHMCTKNYD